MRDDSPPPVEGSSGTLARILEGLDSAARVVGELFADPLLRRLVETFHAMPAEDRAVVVGAIEREVKARRLSRATEDVTGQAMHPNPNARLYLRSHESAIPRGVLERDEMMLAMLSGFHVAPILTTPEIHAEWIDATREAVGHVDDATRAVVVGLLREVLALIE